VITIRDAATGERAVQLPRVEKLGGKMNVLNLKKLIFWA
jgi:hypothetical protein